MTKPIRKTWFFPSASNPKVRYQTLEYTDGTLSCDCPGWTRRIDTNGNRSCKHVRAVEEEIGKPSPKDAHTSIEKTFGRKLAV